MAYQGIPKAPPDAGSLAAPLPLEGLPGHQIRRLQQIAVAVFLQETEGLGITPIQFAALQSVCNSPGIDQRTLARQIGLDTSTVAGVIDRLETRGLLLRSVPPEDRRARVLSITADGLTTLAQVRPGMQRAQQRILAPLDDGEQAQFMRLLDKLVTINNAHSRAPSDA